MSKQGNLGLSSVASRTPIRIKIHVDKSEHILDLARNMYARAT
jgi:hypothetical protein